jgi:exosortase/archaeosortase family protein
VNGRNRSVFLRIGIALSFVVAGFVILQGPARRLETGTSVRLLKAVGAHNVTQTQGVLITVVPSHHAPFQALLAPSCSALASILTIMCLGLLSANSPRGKRVVALGVACGTVAAGNIVRIAASVGIGLVFGRPSLILFHDVAGSIFGLGYTLAGYLIMLHILLPKRRPAVGFVPGSASAFLAGPGDDPTSSREPLPLFGSSPRRLLSRT